MKKLLVVAVFSICAFLTGSAYAAGLVSLDLGVNRLEFDVKTPLHSQTSNTKWSQNLSLSSNFRFNVLNTTIGKFGIEGTPVYNPKDSTLDANFGVNYKPFGIKYLEVHYNHDTNLDMAHLTNGTNSFRGNDYIGARIVVK